MSGTVNDRPEEPAIRTEQAGAPAAASGRRPGQRFEPWLVVAIIALDQLTKALVRAKVPLHDSVPVVAGLLNITYVQNTGAAFGVLNDIEFPYKQVCVALFAAAALTGIAVYAARLPRRDVLARVGLALILGGAAGNLIDRVTAGAVVDFVDVVLGRWHFWAFNVADAAITLGVCAMFLDLFGLGRHVSTTS